ncbi:hypothetical protein [Flavobacterium urumqiense]|uniref:Uncharacterized protein n=1 Tax=Flavobacterium urumqiense TaxID=935224 RepID=A0A1H5Z3W9_9FLAO|nr:hypothetical protein [Flavobacterium urumqiense]SEG30335.1 hypothetical protein SAMN04488130_10955 [Flavobacterium urumqiense]
MNTELALWFLPIIISLILLFKIFSGKVIFETNSEYGTHILNIEKSGFYSLWVSDKILTKFTLERHNAQIINEDDNRFFEMFSFFRANTNNGSNGRMQLSSYYLEKGAYKFRIGNESDSRLIIFDKATRKILYSKETDNFEYKIMKTLPEIIFPLCLIGILMPISEIVKILT